MNILYMLLLGAAACPMYLHASETNDSTTVECDNSIELNEVVVEAGRTVLKQDTDRITYLACNDPYASGLNGIQILDRIPRIFVGNDLVNVAGKSSVKYIIDGHVLEMPDEAIILKLKNLQASDIEKIELFTSPPSKYGAESNVAYISITTHNESLGTRGNLWGNGVTRESFSCMLGGNISHTTRKIELSADISLQNTNGINDLEREYIFYENILTSERSNHFNNRLLAANGLFKYKFSSRLDAGAIVNFSTTRLKSDLWDKTTDDRLKSFTHNISPGQPDNALTLTAFGDWRLGSNGKILSLTYNFFNRHVHTLSDVTTYNNELSRLTDMGKNKYRIHSAKLDMSLPYSSFKIETGLAYNYIHNNTDLLVTDMTYGIPINNYEQSNSFCYNEKTVALYLCAEKNFTDSFFGRLGARYEYTDVTGLQRIGEKIHNNKYNYLLPSLAISWNSHHAGRISLSYSMGLTRPHFGDLNPFRYYNTVSDYFTGNPDLSPSISHNAEINYSFRGVYAVLYNSYGNNAMGYVTRFTPDGCQITMPENYLNTNKIGIYASYRRTLFSRWELQGGGEVYYTRATSKIPDFNSINEHGWSGKLELSSSLMLNRAKTLILHIRFSHYFPWQDKMTHYSAMSLIGCDIRYSLLGNRLNLALSISDPFGWNITRSKTYYADYMMNTRNDIHSHAVSLRISLALGRQKVNQVYRDTKERESTRAY